MRVGVLGAGGRMGALVAEAVAAADDLDLVAAVDPAHAGRTVGGTSVAGDREALLAARCEVVVEFTGPASVGQNLRWLLEHGIHAVVGATGIAADDLEAARRLATQGPARALVVPNFSIGAVLLERFAAEAARHLPGVELIELHHDGKVDAPSGTALAAADAIADARGEAPPPGAGSPARGLVHRGVPIHSVRLPGLLAHQEVLLGGPGQVLTLRHDVLDRAAFVPGVLLAVRRVADVDGLALGLGAVL